MLNTAVCYRRNCWFSCLIIICFAVSLPMSDFDASQVSQMESEELHLKKKRKKNKEKDLDESTVSVGEMACSGSALSFQASGEFLLILLQLSIQKITCF